MWVPWGPEATLFSSGYKIPWLLEEVKRGVVPLIVLFAMLRCHRGLLLSFIGLICWVHPICGIIPVVCPTWRLLLGIRTHYWYLLIGLRILLGIFLRSRRLFYMVVPVRFFYDAILAAYLCRYLGTFFVAICRASQSNRWWDLESSVAIFPSGPFGEDNTFQCQFSIWGWWRL